METKKSQQRFTEEFKTEAVRQVTERGHPVAEVAAHLRMAAGTTVENLSWRDCLERYDRAHTFFYADPLY